MKSRVKRFRGNVADLTANAWLAECKCVAAMTLGYSTRMPALPMVEDSSLFVRTDFANDDAWQELSDEAQQENQDGFRAYLVPVSYPAFDHLGWEAVRAALPVGDRGALVLFIADSTTLNSPDHPVLVVDLNRGADGRPFVASPQNYAALRTT